MSLKKQKGKPYFLRKIISFFVFDFSAFFSRFFFLPTYILLYSSCSISQLIFSKISKSRDRVEFPFKFSDKIVPELLCESECAS